MRLLLTETVELVRREAALEVGARVHAGGGVALVEDLVAARGVLGAAEEVVVPDLVQRRARRVGGDVTADGDVRPLGAVHGDRGVPADPRAVAALDLLVTREGRLVLGGDRVEVVRRRHHRHAEVQLLRALEEAEHDLAPSLRTASLNDRVERLIPFAGLLRIGVCVLDRVRILVVDRHP